ncbi:MAG TPA: hypothetical protein VHB77_05870 [Planctomycetaceae bacterium]|nr:hypothetical protein [Planctomycetaceae bacterium]
MNSLLTFAVAVALTGDIAPVRSRDTTSAAAETQTVRAYNWGRWEVRETANFRIFSLPGHDGAHRLPEVCEALRKDLQGTWFGKGTSEWTPKCDIMVQPNTADYRRILGPASAGSSGCTSLDLEGGRVIKRRIDLRGDAEDWLTAALPHELTHVVVADRFSKRQLPRWADEGMAILAEPEFKQNRRAQELEKAIDRNLLFTGGELVTTREYPAPQRRDAFYGQSASLVGFLIERDSPEKFLQFVELAMDSSYDKALAEVYGITSTTQLDSMWKPRLRIREQTPVLLAERLTRIISTP